nr:hypothetical protein [Tanacetum cinerariifolium]
MENSGTNSENSSAETPFNRSQDETKSSDKERSSSEGYDTNFDIGPSYNSDTVSKGLGLENQNDNVNPSVLNKAKELAPCLYNIYEMRKDELSDHKIISEEELKCKAEKCLKVKQRKSLLLYHGFVYAETQFKETPKVPLKRRNVNLKNDLEQIQNLKEHFKKAQLRDYDPNLWNNLRMKYFCYVKQAMIKFEK